MYHRIIDWIEQIRQNLRNVIYSKKHIESETSDSDPRNVKTPICNVCRKELTNINSSCNRGLCKTRWCSQNWTDIVWWSENNK